MPPGQLEGKRFQVTRANNSETKPFECVTLIEKDETTKQNGLDQTRLDVEAGVSNEQLQSGQSHQNMACFAFFEFYAFG